MFNSLYTILNLHSMRRKRSTVVTDEGRLFLVNFLAKPDAGDPGHFVLLMRLSCRRFWIYCRLTFSALGACVCIWKGKGTRFIPPRSAVYTGNARWTGLSDTRPPGIRLPVIISPPVKVLGQKRDIYARHCFHRPPSDVFSLCYCYYKGHFLWNEFFLPASCPPRMYLFDQLLYLFPNSKTTAMQHVLRIY